MFDALIIPVLALYGALLLLATTISATANSAAFVAVLFGVRWFAIGFRTDVGTDIDNYVSVLATCDLTSINSIEIFWQLACLPSEAMTSFFNLPFLWIGLADSLLFLAIVRVGSLRIASLHDLIYLSTQSMGAIRQGLAMKMAFIAVLLIVQHLSTNKQRPMSGHSTPTRFAMGTPRAARYLLISGAFVHMAALIPIFGVVLIRGKPLIRLVMGSIIILSLLYAQSIDIWDKVQFYLEFEGFRSATQIYFSWGKRVVIIVMVLLIAKPPRIVWLLYGLALLFGMLEFYIAEIAVRGGAYFEQFEILLIASPIRPQFRKLTPYWWLGWGLFYTVRYWANIAGLNA